MDPRLGTTALVLTIEALLGFNVRNLLVFCHFIEKYILISMNLGILYD